MSQSKSSFNLEQLESRFLDSWQRLGTAPDLAEFLADLDFSQRRHALQVLIPIDIQQRFQAGENVRADLYSPYGDSAIAIAAELFSGEAPDTPAEELQTRFESAPSNSDSESFSVEQPESAATNLITDRYRLINKIGQGGMGTVWLAQQEKPMRRRVAIKIIGKTMDSNEALARFGAERQALAMMNHPNIAKVLDAGMTEDGRPFFAMELVKGVSITRYCDDHRLTIEERLELMIPVCEAVQHAHQKGIIHRDLKPSNILVSFHDDQPIAKVIDFGLAKALEHTARLTEETLVTEVGRVVGTLQYMSPEQAGSSELDVDTRSDIYSLGVILYQLLTDAVPLETDSLTGKSLLQIVEMIRDLSIVRPSQKLVDDDELAVVCAQRQTNSRYLINKLEGELDWIVMKSLRSDRTERYQAASALADDVRRFLNDEPVEARPPSMVYRLKKFAGNNRGLVAAIGLFIGLLSTALVVISFLWQTANAAKLDEIVQKDLANEAKIEAEKERNEADRLRIEAENAEDDLEIEKRKSEKRVEILLKPYEEIDPLAGGNLDLNPTQFLNKTLQYIDEELVDDQEFISEAKLKIGNSLLGMSALPESVDALSQSHETRKALFGSESEKALKANISKQIAILESLKVDISSRSTFGEADTLVIAKKIEDALDEFVLSTKKLKPSAKRLGQAYLMAFKELKKLNIEREEYINNAIGILEQQYKVNKQKEGPQSDTAMNAYFNLANALLKEGSKSNIDKSIQMNLTLVGEWEQKSKSDDEYTKRKYRIRRSQATNNLAESYHAKAKLEDDRELYDKAIENFESAMIAKTELFQKNHSSRFNTIRNMIECMCDASRFAEAKQKFDEIRSQFINSDKKDYVISNAVKQMDAMQQKFAKTFGLDENWTKVE